MYKIPIFVSQNREKTVALKVEVEKMINIKNLNNFTYKYKKSLLVLMIHTINSEWLY